MKLWIGSKINKGKALPVKVKKSDKLFPILLKDVHFATKEDLKAIRCQAYTHII
jgi:hypothetical protein